MKLPGIGNANLVQVMTPQYSHYQFSKVDSMNYAEFLEHELDDPKSMIYYVKDHLVYVSRYEINPSKMVNELDWTRSSTEIYNECHAFGNQLGERT